MSEIRKCESAIGDRLGKQFIITEYVVDYKPVIAPKITEDAIIELVATEFSIDAGDLRSMTLNRATARARYACYHLLKLFLGYDYKQIAKPFNIDFTNVRYGMGRHRDNMDFDKPYARTVMRIETVIKTQLSH